MPNYGIYVLVFRIQIFGVHKNNKLFIRGITNSEDHSAKAFDLKFLWHLRISQQNALMKNYTAKMSLVPDDRNGGVF